MPDDALDLDLIDLTAVSRPDIRVKMRKSDDTEMIYRLPGNAPSGLIVDLMVLLREIDRVDAEDIDLIADLRGQLQERVDELMSLRNPDYVDGDVRLADEELGALIAGMFERYYGSKPTADAEGGDRPTVPEEAPEPEPTASSTRPTPPRRRSEPPSRASSQRDRAAAPSRS